MKPVTLPPGRGKLATKPLPTGSETFAKMMGMVRVCCSNAAVVGVFCERMRSGCSATSSFANRCIDSASPASPSECRSGCCGPPPTRASGVPRGTPRRRPVLPGRSRHTPSARRSAASARLLRARGERPRRAAPPSSVMNSRRLMGSNPGGRLGDRNSAREPYQTFAQKYVKGASSPAEAGRLPSVRLMVPRR